MSDFSILLGRTLVRVEGAHEGSEAITLYDNEGGEFVLQHVQDCCERVDVNEIIGDVADVLGSPLLRAEEVTNNNEGDPPSEYAESYTWTFYKLATIKGEVVLRWLGESNGYYSESVDFKQTKLSLRDAARLALQGNPADAADIGDPTDETS